MNAIYDDAMHFAKEPFIRMERDYRMGMGNETTN
jgi:hypothetical protein